jgi:hypothetical protein
MWVQDNQKKSELFHIKNDLNSSVTNLNHEIGQLNETISLIDYAIGGIPSGKDNELSDYCRRVQEDINYCISRIEYCKNCLDQLNTEKWVENDEY